LKKQELHPFVPRGCHLRIIERVKVQQREALDPCVSVERVRMKRVNPCPLCLPRSLCVEFDSIMCDVSGFGELKECGSRASARVEHRCRFQREVE